MTQPHYGRYTVTTIDGRKVGPPVGRGNQYQVVYSQTGLVVSLGCATVSIPGNVQQGIFIPSSPSDGAMVTHGGPCGILPEDQLEPEFQRSALTGTLRVSGDSNRIVLGTQIHTIAGVR